MDTQMRRRVLWIVGQAGLVLLGAFLYFRIRGLTAADPGVAIRHARGLVDLEQDLHINVESSLQDPVTDSVAMKTLANWIYIWGHWPVIIATMVWLAVRHTAVFLRLRDAMLISGAVGLLIFVTYPVAPPRLLDIGLVDTVTQESQSYRVLQPPAFVNQYAAMPSLHSGWDLLVGIAIVTAASSVALKAVGYAMPVLMALAVVVTANHYVLDVVAGIALVLIGHAAALRLERRRNRRHQGTHEGGRRPPSSAPRRPPPPATPPRVPPQRHKRAVPSHRAGPG